MSNITAAILYGVVAIACMVVTFRSFNEKGFLLNNAYLYATKEQKMTMNKRPYYRQTAICFAILTVFFIVDLIDALVKTEFLIWIQSVLLIGLAVYALVSSFLIRKIYR